LILDTSGLYAGPKPLNAPPGKRVDQDSLNQSPLSNSPPLVMIEAPPPLGNTKQQFHVHLPPFRIKNSETKFQHGDPPFTQVLVFDIFFFFFSPHHLSYPAWHPPAEIYRFPLLGGFSLSSILVSLVFGRSCIGFFFGFFCIKRLPPLPEDASMYFSRTLRCFVSESYRPRLTSSSSKTIHSFPLSFKTPWLAFPPLPGVDV